MIEKLKRIFTGSKSNFFFDKEDVLIRRRKDVEVILTIKGYEIHQRAVYLAAFDYFVKHPEQFDGATMTEDLFDIPGLDLDAMLHDYLYICLQAAVSWKYTVMCDRLLRSEMLRKGKSSWNTGYRFVMLTLKTPFFLVFCWLKGRRITEAQKEELDVVLREMNIAPPKVWHKEYRGELTWTAIILVIIIGYIWRVTLTSFVDQLMWLFR